MDVAFAVCSPCVLFWNISTHYQESPLTLLNIIVLSPFFIFYFIFFFIFFFFFFFFVCVISSLTAGSSTKILISFETFVVFVINNKIRNKWTINRHQNWSSGPIRHIYCTSVWNITKFLLQFKSNETEKKHGIWTKYWGTRILETTLVFQDVNISNYNVLFDTCHTLICKFNDRGNTLIPITLL